MVYKASLTQSLSFRYFLISGTIVVILCICDIYYGLPKLLGPILIFILYMQRVLRHCRFLEIQENDVILRNRLLPFLKKQVSKKNLSSKNICKSYFYNKKTLKLCINFSNRKEKEYELGCVTSDMLKSIQQDLDKF